MTLNRPMHDAAERSVDRPQRGVLAQLAAATAIGSTGLAAGGTAGALLAVDIAGTRAVAGVPLGLLVVGSAAGAALLSQQAARGHRGRGLALGYAIGVAGALVVVMAAVWRSLPVLLIGSVALGVANSSVFMARYAAMDAATQGTRGRALGAVFTATAVGAIVSPMLLGPSGAAAQAAGLPSLAGLYLVAVIAFGLSSLLLAALSKARVPRLGRRADKPRGLAVLTGTLKRPDAKVAVTVLAATNFVMVGVMTIAPLHLTGHGQSLDQVGAVIALHVAGMFAVSPVSGFLADRYGPAAVARLGGVLLTVAVLIGLFIDSSGLLTMTVHLTILGVGWNCGVVGGSTLLGESVPAASRPHVEGIAEVMMGLAAAAAGPAAGVIAEFGGYLAFCLISAPAAVFVIVLARGDLRETADL